GAPFAPGDLGYRPSEDQGRGRGDCAMAGRKGGPARGSRGAALVFGVNDRLGSTRFLHDNIRKVFPKHWSFLLGEIALYSFIILVITGVFLTLFFRPSGTGV